MMLKGEVIDFNLYKMDSDSLQKSTLLVISGIQGDEPGAFNATSILIKHYKIAKGSLWVIPNLNQHSILKNNRGIYGDMNRKFAEIPLNDPEYHIIQNVKSVILNEQVDRILHLHDGSGFYRETYISPLLNQNRWGNCSIIDQDTLFEYGDLNQNITSVIDYINENLLDEIHRFRVRNTDTANGDTEQSKSLTYFATINQKMAFASEASKSLPLEKRVYYHLLAIEGMLKNSGIEFERDFTLTLDNIKNLINDKTLNIIIEDIINLPLYNIKSQLNYFPLHKNKINFYSNTPIVWLFKDGENYRIKNGNRAITILKPFFIDFDSSLEGADLIVDGKEIYAKIGSTIKVKSSFSVKNLPYRVNVIGFNAKGSEVDINITRRDLMGRFAIDKNNTKFRIEFYKTKSQETFARESLVDSGDSAKNEATKEAFAGMIIVDFDKTSQ